MIVTKEYAVSHLQRHELYHDAFLLHIRFVDCQCFPHTFDFRHWRTVDTVGAWTESTFRYNFGQRLGKGSFGEASNGRGTEGASFLRMFLDWRWRWLFRQAWRAVTLDGSMKEVVLKRLFVEKGEHVRRSTIWEFWAEWCKYDRQMNASMKTIGNGILDLGVVKGRSTLAPSCSTDTTLQGGIPQSDTDVAIVASLFFGPKPKLLVGFWSPSKK